MIYKILLRVACKLSFASRTAEVEISTVIGAVMPCRGYLHSHCADRINSSLNYSHNIMGLRLPFLKGDSGMFTASRLVSSYLYQLCQDTGRDFLWRHRSHIKSSRHLQTLNLCNA